MTRPFFLLFALTATALLLAVGSIMNTACKTSQHAWCAPNSEFRHPIELSHS
jgi:hypothetical protein